MAYADIQSYGPGGGYQQVPMMEYNQPGSASYGMMNRVQEPNSFAAGIYSLMMPSQEDDLQQVLKYFKLLYLSSNVTEPATFNLYCRKKTLFVDISLGRECEFTIINYCFILVDGSVAMG